MGRQVTRSIPLLRLFLAGLLPVALAACGSPSERPPRIAPADVERARTVLLPLKKELLAALTQALAEGGPEAAIHVCQLRAPAIAASASPEGVAMGRTSLRLRNPENAPRPWVRPLLAEYQAAKRARKAAARQSRSSS